jgi:hypothetical protein
MNSNCPPSPVDKRAYIADIGEILVKDFGKKKYYKPQEVKSAQAKSKWYRGTDFSCWGMSTYSSHADFDAYHEQTGEACDYVQMKSEMLKAISTTDVAHLPDFPDHDVEASWLDLGDVFDKVLGGIGEFFSSIGDNDGDLDVDIDV